MNAGRDEGNLVVFGTEDESYVVACAWSVVHFNLCDVAFSYIFYVFCFCE